MKYIKLYEEFHVDESIKKIDMEKINSFLEKLKTKVDETIISNIKKYVSMCIVDPYETYSDLINSLKQRYNTIDFTEIQ